MLSPNCVIFGTVINTLMYITDGANQRDDRCSQSGQRDGQSQTQNVGPTKEGNLQGRPCTGKLTIGISQWVDQVKHK